MKHEKERGFTIVELVIVIAVIAILAAALIPTFAGAIKKANQSADLQTVRNIHLILQMEEAVGGQITNAEQVKDILNENGITFFQPSYDGYALYWDPKGSSIVLYDSEQSIAIYPENYKGASTNNSEWELLTWETDEPSVSPEKDESTVICRLTNISISNPAETVKKNTSYTATLTPTEGYELATVTVMMAGSDITHTAYSDGKIFVSSVTGDLEIIATAVPTGGSVTNLGQIAQSQTGTDIYNGGLGYKNGSYISDNESSNYEGTDADTVATGWIPYMVPEEGVPPSIDIQGGDWSNQESHCRIIFFDANKKFAGLQFMGTSTGKNTDTDIEKFFTLEHPGDEHHFRLIPKTETDGDWIGCTYKDAMYIRFSLVADSGENLIITFENGTIESEGS